MIHPLKGVYETFFYLGIQEPTRISRLPSSSAERSDTCEVVDVHFAKLNSQGTRERWLIGCASHFENEIPLVISDSPRFINSGMV